MPAANPKRRPGNRRDRVRRPGSVAAAALALGLLVTVGGTTLAVSGAAAASPSVVAADPVFVPIKYYIVPRSLDGGTESLPDVARQVLGSASRAPEILELNRGRRQPDGFAMTDADTVHPGWILWLPLDAKGEGVQLGRVQAAVGTRRKRPESAGAPSGRFTNQADSDRTQRAGSRISNDDASAELAASQWVGGLIGILGLAAGGFLLRFSRARQQATPSGQVQAKPIGSPVPPVVRLRESALSYLRDLTASHRRSEPSPGGRHRASESSAGPRNRGVT